MTQKRLPKTKYHKVHRADSINHASAKIRYSFENREKEPTHKNVKKMFIKSSKKGINYI